MTSENGMTPADVAAVMGGNRGNGGFGDLGFGGGWGLLILLAVLGWGNGGFGGFGGGNGGMMWPWMVGQQNTYSDVQRGFDQSAVMSGINGLNTAVVTGFGNVQNAMCGGFAGVNAAIANGFAQAEIAENARQMANMQSANALQSQLAQCCCDNRLATANLQSTILSENCADRAAISDALRDVITANNASTQKILDQMCQDRIDAKNEEIARLRNALNMANLQASQTAQTSRILSDNAAQTVTLEQYLNPTPIPAYVVPRPGSDTTTTTGA